MRTMLMVLGLGTAAMLSGAVIAQTAPNPGDLKVDPKVAKAKIIPAVPITVVVNGAGRVRWGGFQCSPGGNQNSTSCVRNAAPGQRLAFQALPDANFSLGSWAGPCTLLNGECRITVAEPVTITANFQRAQRTLTIRYRERPSNRLLVFVTSSATPACTATPAGGSAANVECVRTVPAGVPLKITAQRVGSTSNVYPIAGSRWSGACAGSPGLQCSLAMEADKLVVIDPNYQ